GAWQAQWLFNGSAAQALERPGPGSGDYHSPRPRRRPLATRRALNRRPTATRSLGTILTVRPTAAPVATVPASTRLRQPARFGPVTLAFPTPAAKIATAARCPLLGRSPRMIRDKLETR